MPRFLRQKIVRITQDEFTVSTAVIITNKKGEVLLLDHVLRPASGWGIPGGFIEHGEQPSEAIKREICEEINLELKNLEMFQVRTVNRHVEILFRAEADGEASVKSLEINALRWFKVDELPLEMNRNQKSLIEKLLKQSNGDSN